MRPKKKSYRRRYKIAGRNQFVKTAIIVMAASLISGAFLASNNFFSHMDSLVHYVSQAKAMDKLTNVQQMDLLLNGFLKHTLMLLFIWFSGFIPIGIISSFSILAVRSISVGFTAAAFIKVYRLKGLYYMLILTLPQNIIIFPVYLLAVYSCTKFVFGQENASKNHGHHMSLTEYVLILIFCIVIAGIVSFYEAYATPWIINNLIN